MVGIAIKTDQDLDPRNSMLTQSSTSATYSLSRSRTDETRRFPQGTGQWPLPRWWRIRQALLRNKGALKFAPTSIRGMPIVALVEAGALATPAFSASIHR